MITIIINPEIGLDLFNISEEIISVARGGINEPPNGGLRFDVDNVNSDRVIDILRSQAPLGTTLNRVGSCVFLSLRQDRQDDEEDELPDPRDEDEFDDENDNEDDHEEEDIQEPSMEESDVQQIENSLSDEESKTAIAAAMENEISSQAKNLEDKIIVFTQEWTRLISKKREIEEMMIPIQDNPIISRLIEQVGEIREYDIIESIFFKPEHIVVYTHELATDNPIEGSRRKIGRMEFKIKLKPLVSNSAECRSPITIRNLDRVCNDGCEKWECGHVPHPGTNICFGTAFEMIFNAFSSRDVRAIVDILIRFVRNPNPTDVWGRHMKYWPVEGI